MPGLGGFFIGIVTILNIKLKPDLHSSVYGH